MPSFSIPIELPPESNPLRPDLLLNTLRSASSNDQQQVRVGAAQLQNWETEPGYYSLLQDAFVDRSLPLETRYLAAIQLKNGIDKYWRKTARNAIGKEEKAHIRSRCIQAGMDEPDRRLALQNAVLVAKIMRIEYPHDWPDAMSAVGEQLHRASQDGNIIMLSRALLIMLYIVKELSTARLQRSRVELQKVAPEIVQTLARIYAEHVQKWMGFFRHGGDDEGGAIAAVELSLLALRILRRLLVSGYEHPNRHVEVHETWEAIRVHFGEMFSLLRQHGGSIQNAVHSQIEKHLVQMSKLHLEILRTHPAAFPQLPHAIEIAKAYWSLLLEFGATFGTQNAAAAAGGGGDDDDSVSYMEKLSLKGLLIIRACAKMVYNPTKTFKYQQKQDKEERSDAVEAMKKSLLSSELIREMMETIVVRFFVFRPRDIREWQSDPEDWERREDSEGEAWEYSIRICAEKLFLDLVINNKDILIPPLLKVFYSVATPDNTDILMKDSLYAAVGLSAAVLKGHFDFSQFLATTLVPEVQIQQPGYNVLRRRTAIFLGQWMLVEESGPNAAQDKASAYQIFSFLLNKDDSLNDLVVRITAGRQLKNIVEPYEMQVDPFMPHAEATVGRIIAVVEEVETIETKIALLNTLNTLVVSMEQKVSPIADLIFSSLPRLWEQAGEEYLVKQTVLGICSSLITALQSGSVRYHSLILPLIRSAVTPESEAYAYLYEEALDLWASIVSQAPEPTADLLDMRGLLAPLFDTASQTLKKALEITEIYIYLAPQAMLEQSSALASQLTSLLQAKLNREASGTVVHLAELLLRFADRLGGSSAVQNVATSFMQAALLPHIVAGLKDAHEAHQTSGPNRRQPQLDLLVETDYMCTLSRIALSDPHLLVEVIRSSDQSDENTAMSWFLTELFAHFESVSRPERKKLVCLALTALLRLGPKSWLLSRLQEVMGVWSDVIAEVVEYDEQGNPGRDLEVYVWKDEYKTSASEAPDDARKREMLYADPVHTVEVRSYIAENLKSMIDACGGQDTFQREWLVNVDRDVVKSFGKMGVL